MTEKTGNGPSDLAVGQIGYIHKMEYHLREVNGPEIDQFQYSGSAGFNVENKANYRMRYGTIYVN